MCVFGKLQSDTMNNLFLVVVTAICDKKFLSPPLHLHTLHN